MYKRQSLIRVGLDNIPGSLAGGIAAWIDAGQSLAHIPQASTTEAHALLPAATLLDVRSDSEWKSGHVPGSVHIMLGDLPHRLAEVPATPLVVLCGSGYRSSIATSILAAHGRHDVTNIDGGMAAWNRQGLPVDLS